MIKPMFIVFEGVDGCGKTTLLESFKEYLIKSNIPVIINKEPWDGHKSTHKWIRKILDKEIMVDRSILEFLLLINRYHNNIWIKKKMKMGFTILQDRSFISSVAYQYIFSEDFIVNMNSRFQRIDLLLFVNTPADECIRRINTRGEKKTLYERIEKLMSANQRYVNFIDKYNEVDEDIRPYVKSYKLDGLNSKKDLYSNLILIWEQFVMWK